MKKTANSIIYKLTRAECTKEKRQTLCRVLQSLPALLRGDVILRRGMQAAAVPFPVIGRGAEEFPEIACEGGDRGKSAVDRDDLHGGVRLPQELTGLLDADQIQIVHGRHVDVVLEDAAEMRLAHILVFVSDNFRIKVP